MPGLDVDLTDLDNFADGFPHHVFARHRQEMPALCDEPLPRGQPGPSREHTGLRHLPVRFRPR
jgi:hypothetical protein